MGAASKWAEISTEVVTLLTGLAPIVVLVLGLALAERLLPFGARLVNRARAMFTGGARRGGAAVSSEPRTARVRNDGGGR